MKQFILTLLAALPLLFVGCSNEDIRYEIESATDHMHLKPSVSSLTLDQDKGAETALTFKWDKAADRGEGTHINYYFKMDIEGNKFETAIPKVAIAANQNTISFTHKQMNAYLSMWGVKPGATANVEAEIIAEVTGGDHYMKPEVSTTTVALTGYVIAPRPLYLFPATATTGNGLEMEEVLSETKYKFAGGLTAGTYKIARTATSNAVATVNVTQSGFALIDLDLSQTPVQPTISYPQPEINNLYLVGSATPAGWNIGGSLPLTQDPLNKFIFTWTGSLNAGELKFPLDPGQGWGTPFVFAATQDQSITNPKADKHQGDPDNKWKLTAADAGDYTIIVDTYHMTVQFKHIASIIPADVPYKKLWALGSATSTGWNTPFSLAFTYDPNAPKGTFVIETHLQPGEMKFALDNTSGFACDYIMPRNVNASGLARLSQTQVEMVPGGNPDKKWEVVAGEEGDYKISVNVMTMHVTFHKK